MKVELICYLFHKNMADLGVKLSDMGARVTMDTDTIETVHEWAEDDEYDISAKKSMVHLKSGDSYLIGKTYDEMIELWKR
jgi:acyl-CoA synthetase (NDP forming)